MRAPGGRQAADSVQREVARRFDVGSVAERGHGQERGLGLRERIVEAGVGVRQVRHLVTGDGEACGHELRGEVVLAAVAAEDGKILDQIHPFFPTYPMREEPGMGPVCAAKGEKRRSRASVDLSGHLLRKCHLPFVRGGKPLRQGYKNRKATQ